jgi:hypothetical protein
VREGRSVSGCTTAALTDTCGASALNRYVVHAPCSLADGRATSAWQLTNGDGKALRVLQGIVCGGVAVVSRESRVES